MSGVGSKAKHGISNGPDAHELVFAFEHAYGSIETVAVFQGSLEGVHGVQILRMKITSLQHDGESGSVFIFHAIMTVDSKDVHVDGMYNAETRRGCYSS